MDGLNVNWAFMRKLTNIKTDSNAPLPIDIGSCGLHTTHVVFKSGFKQAGTGPSRRHIQGSKIAKGHQSSKVFSSTALIFF